MQDTRDKVAFISGGASGIGLGMTQAFIEAGMKVVIADIRQAALDKAMETLDADGETVLPLRLDTTDRAGWVRAADAAEKAAGRVDNLQNRLRQLELAIRRLRFLINNPVTDQEEKKDLRQRLRTYLDQQRLLKLRHPDLNSQASQQN